MPELWNEAPLSIWWSPADDRGPACLALEVAGPKQYRRIWSPGTDAEAGDWGWMLSPKAVCIWRRPDYDPEQWRLNNPPNG